MTKRSVLTLAICLAIAFTAGGIGSIATATNVTTWYPTIEKPWFNPPNWVFGPVWTTLYTMMGVSLFLVWSARTAKPKKAAITAFGIQLALNTLWSLVFFGLHWLWASVAIIAALLAAIAATARLFWPISRPAAYLLIPYFAWVSFATVLTVAVALLNE